MQKVDKGLFQLVEIAAIGAHVIGINIGHHGNHRLQMQEAGVTFIRFSNQIAAAAQLGITAGGINSATNHKGRVKIGCSKDSGQQAGGGGFAVSTGHGNAVPVAHQLSQHLGARNHRNAAFQRTCDLRVFLVDGTGNYQHVRLFHIGCLMPQNDLDAQSLQTLGH